MVRLFGETPMGINQMASLKVPFHVPWITDQDKRAVLDALSSRWLTGGPALSKFEELFAEYIGVKHAVAVSNCTAALHVTLRSLGIKPGDEVIVPDFTFASTANAALHCGARPVFCDVDLRTFNTSPMEVQNRISERTKAIIVVHYGGLACEMEAIKEIADHHGLPIVEDCAHSLGATYRSKKTGSIGKAGCFSFYPTKNITTIEGGMITTDDDEIARRARLLRSHCMTRTPLERESKKEWYYDIVDLGYNYRLNEVQAALGISQLKRVDEAKNKRVGAANFYNRCLADVDGIVRPHIASGHVYHLYAVRVVEQQFGTNRDSAFKYLSAKGIESSVHYTPLHLLEYYGRTLHYRVGDFPVAEQLGREVLSLPIFPTITEEQLDFVCNGIKGVREQAKAHFEAS